MRKRALWVIIGCVAALTLVAAQPAAAATQVGNNCIGDATDELEGQVTLVTIANPPGSPLPAAVPSAGVITRWTLSATPILPPNVLTQSMKVLRPTGPLQFQVVGESSGLMLPGLNSFSTRIPVQAGDQLGTIGFAPPVPEESVTLYCKGAPVPGGVVGFAPGNPGVGSPLAVAAQESGTQIPIVATVEPDADNDGFGDETQDACPQVATTQAICPVVVVEASSVIKRKASVVVLVTANNSAPVKVTGTANLGKGKKAKFSSKTLTVVPGKVTRFTLNFPKKLKNRLGDLPRKRSLQLKLTASATDLIGRVTTDSLKTKLKGQAKAKKPRRAAK